MIQPRKKRGREVTSSVQDKAKRKLRCIPAHQSEDGREMIIWEIRHRRRRRRALPLFWWTKNPLVFVFRLGCAVVTCSDGRSSKPCSRTQIRNGRSRQTRNLPLPARFIHTPARGAVASCVSGGGTKNYQCQKKDEQQLCRCICCITYFSNWIHLFIFI